MATTEAIATTITEPILTPSQHRRYAVYPIQYPDVWEMYQKAIGLFWTTRVVRLSDDVVQWVAPPGSPHYIDEKTKQFVKMILGFFSQFDLIVNQNLGENFMTEVQPVEMQMFYGFQVAIENIHSEQYANLIEAYISDKKEKEGLLQSIDTIPSVKEMAKWAFKWMNKDRPFKERLIAFACIEGIMFSGPFAGIYYLKQKNILPGLCEANEYISRDEGMHTDFACLLHSYLIEKASDEAILEIVKEATELEIAFVNESIPVSLIGMNDASMAEYIRFVADRLLLQLKVGRYYHATNPFPFMEQIGGDIKTDFFSKKVTAYSKAGFKKSGNDHYGGSGGLSSSQYNNNDGSNIYLLEEF